MCVCGEGGPGNNEKEENKVLNTNDIKSGLFLHKITLPLLCKSKGRLLLEILIGLVG